MGGAVQGGDMALGFLQSALGHDRPAPLVDLKHQRVGVEAVGAWAVVERIVPVWAKGFDEPVRVTYDVGLGRDFAGAELQLAVDEQPHASA